MPELRLDDDGYLNMAALDDDAELSDAQTDRADTILRQAFDADLSSTWRAAVERSPVGDDVVYLEAEVVPVERLDSHRRNRLPALFAAAAGILMILGAVGLGLGWFTDDEPTTEFGETATVTPAPTAEPEPTVDDAGAVDDGDAVESTDPEPAEPGPSLEQIVVVGDAPRKPVPAGDALWVANRGGDTVTRIDGAGERSDIVVGARPDTALAAAGALWAPARDDDRLTRIDLETLETVAIDIGGDPDTPVAAADHIWVALRGDRALAVVDPATGDVVQRIRLDGRPLTPELFDGSLWFVTRDDNQLHRIRLDDWQPDVQPTLESIEVGADPDRPLVAGGRLWVPARDDARIDVVDPQAGEVLAAVEVGGLPDTPIATERRVWVSNAGGTDITVIDLESIEVVDVIEVGPTPRTGVVDADTVWVPVAGSGDVVAIDADSLEIIARIEVGVAPDTPAVIGDSLWVPDAEGAALVEIRLR